MSFLLVFGLLCHHIDGRYPLPEFRQRTPTNDYSGSHYAGPHYPKSHYPASSCPNSRYPESPSLDPYHESNYPRSRYPESNYFRSDFPPPHSPYHGSNYPRSHTTGLNYPKSHYPPSHYPDTRYPESSDYGYNYPVSHYPDSHYSDTSYPNSPYHGSQYPGSNYPGSLYPEPHYTESPYHGSNYPGSLYPEPHYPESPYHGSNYPGSLYPEPHYPKSPYHGSNYHGSPYQGPSYTGSSYPDGFDEKTGSTMTVGGNRDANPQPKPATMSMPVPRLGQFFAPLLQWHVGIYSKSFTPYMQICGGSIVKPDVVLSAAHCFWNDVVGQLRAGLFAVGAGKLLRPWMTEEELFAQHSDVKSIKIPPRFQGVKTSFQDDIAVVFLTSDLEYVPGVKPVCVSFDLVLERRHLTRGNLGTVAGWGLTEPNGPPSQRLNFVKLPYVDIEDCLRTSIESFLKYITSDKICAGDWKSGRALCRGDSGGGLVFDYSRTPYLRGIASTAPRDNNACNARTVATFTHVLAQRAFLIAHVPNIEEGCEELYYDEVKNETMELPEILRTVFLATPSHAQRSNVTLENELSNVSTQFTLTERSQNTSSLTDRPKWLTPSGEVKLEGETSSEEAKGRETPNEEATDIEKSNEEVVQVERLIPNENKKGVVVISADINKMFTPTKDTTDLKVMLSTEMKEMTRNAETKEGVTPSKSKQMDIMFNADVAEVSITSSEEMEKIVTSGVEVTSRKKAIEIVTPKKNKTVMMAKEDVKEVVVNVWNGEKGVARIPVENGTKIFVFIVIPK